MAQLDKAFTGLRILVVEDNFLAAEVVRDTLESNGCTVVGPVGRIADGLRPARRPSKPVLGPHLIEALSEVI